MACEYLKNCEKLQRIWDQVKNVMDAKTFVEGALCPAGYQDLNVLENDLKNAMESAGFVVKTMLGQAQSLIKKAKEYVDQRDVAKLSSLVSNKIVCMGVKALNDDDKKTFQFVQGMLKEVK